MQDVPQPALTEEEERNIKRKNKNPRCNKLIINITARVFVLSGLAPFAQTLSAVYTIIALNQHQILLPFKTILFICLTN